jgi:hypothetical protein
LNVVFRRIAGTLLRPVRRPFHGKRGIWRRRSPCPAAPLKRHLPSVSLRRPAGIAIKDAWARQSVWHIMQDDWRILLVTTLLCYAIMELSLQFWEAQREPVQMAEPHCKETQNDRVQSCESGEGF